MWKSTRPGKHTKSYGKSPFSMGKSTINGHFLWKITIEIVDFPMKNGEL